MFENISGNTQEFHNQNLGDNTVTLYVISPRNIPQQVIRPYTYNFNDELLEDLKDQGELKTFFGPRSRGAHKDSTARAIIPTPMGSVINTNDLSMMWSFILVCDISANGGNKYALPSNKSRILSTGFFTDEPLNPLTLNNTTPTVNPDAIMQFTHSSVIALQDSIQPRTGRNTSMFIPHDNDCINSMIDTCKTTDLYLMSPSDIRECSRGRNQDGNLISSYGDKHTSMLNTNNVVTPTRLKSPKHQFQEILHALDYAVDHENTEYPSSALTNGGYGDPLDQFTDVFDANLMSDSKFTPLMGIDVSQPMTMHQLMYKFPNVIIMPFKVPMNSSWDVRPQDEVNVHNQMSSMVASTIGTLATGSGLAEVSFRYNSSVGGSLDPLGGGVWQIQHVKTMVPTDDAGMKGCFNAFKQMLSYDLWPILKSVAGEFDIMLSHNITGETVVGLQFLDSAVMHGMYETCNRMGGMTSPILGDINTFSSNVTELQSLVDHMAVNAGIGGYFESSKKSQSNDLSSSSWNVTEDPWSTTESNWQPNSNDDNDPQLSIDSDFFN